METLAEIKKKYKRVQPEEAEKHWQEQFEASVTTCSHAYWRGVCKRRSVGVDCDVGRRARTYHVLSGETGEPVMSSQVRMGHRSCPLR